MADATPTAGRQASKGYLVRVRRNVSVRASTRRPRKGRLVRFSGLIRPALSTPAAMVVVQRKNSADAYSAVASTPPAAAGAEASQYTLRVRIRRPGTYRVYVTGTYFSPGASPPFVLRVRR